MIDLQVYDLRTHLPMFTDIDKNRTLDVCVCYLQGRNWFSATANDRGGQGASGVRTMQDAVKPQPSRYYPEMYADHQPFGHFVSNELCVIIG